jgi:SAM-dependent methyltransferase
MLSKSEDAHGRMTYDHFLGVDTPAFIERDDGMLHASPGVEMYFAPFRKWPKHERDAMRYVRGRVLDVGCGAGRAALHLQARGKDVLGIDSSPLAIKTCRLRGVRRTRVLLVTQVSRRLGQFDTILMFGNNFGLMENKKRARWQLGRFGAITGDSGRIVAETMDPYDTDDPLHLRYHKRNLRSGRMAGQARIRVRYQTYRTPWFDYLLVSRDEMKRLIDGTPWEVERFIDSDGPVYVVVLRKTAAGKH